MSKLQPYPEYKDSGIEWIGKIPTNWITIQLKRLLSIKVTDGPHETPALFDSGVPFVSAESVRNGRIDFSLKRGFISQEAHKQYKKKCLPQKDDILMVKSGATTGNIAIVDVNKEFSIWSPLALIRANPKIISPYYLFYYISSSLFKSQVETRWNYGTQQNIGMNVIENLIVILPTLNDQAELVQYLDEKTSQIDSLIADKERLIELLEEKRQAVITETVTKGLDPNVKMKDSGIEWIGEIPKHWEVIKLKYLFNIINGGTPKSNVKEYWDDDIVWITPQDLSSNGHVFSDSIRNISEQGLVNSSATYIRSGSIAISTRAPIGNMKIANVDYTTNQGCKSLEKNSESVTEEFFFYYLQSKKEVLQNLGQGTTFLELSNTSLKEFLVPLPSISEQQNIVEKISDFNSIINSVMGDIKYQITKLKEYRESLIYEAVTGKIDVRNYEVEPIEV